MSKRKKKGDAPASSWLDTYADTITLLLTFFVLLYASSSADAEKFASMAEAFQSVLTGKSSNSILEYNLETGDLPVVGEVVPPNNTNAISNAEIYENMQNFICENNLEGQVEVIEDSRGYIFELKDKILFESGKANLKEESLPILDVLTEYISKVPNDIIIEGHTDNVPINNYKYKDNWQLSAARTYTVMSYFIKDKSLDPNRFSGAFYGEEKPLVENDTEENRAKNRRVNILIVTETEEQGGEENGQE